MGLKLMFLIFISYSIFGWIIEVILKYKQYKRFINRGFFIGPYCPIYGVGALFMTLLLSDYDKHPIILFLMAILICSTLEYFTSFILEKIYHARWWDYSTKKCNLNGRICLETTIKFGIGGVLMIYIFNPILFKLINSINGITLNLITIILAIVFFTDLIISFAVLVRIKKNDLGVEKDNTEEIRRKSNKIILNSGILRRRLLRAYPTFLSLIKKVKK